MLTLKKGGKLVQRTWKYNEKKDEGKYVYDDVTDHSCMYLFTRCELEDGVTLRDIFLLMQKNINVYSVIFYRDYCKDFVEKGLALKRRKPKKNTYIVLNFNIETNEYDDKEYEIEGHAFPEMYILHKNERYSVMGFTLQELTDLPILLHPDMTFTMQNPNVKRTDKPVKPTFSYTNILFGEAQFTLGQILHALMWELAFFGSPEEAEEKRKEILDIANSVKKEIK